MRYKVLGDDYTSLPCLISDIDESKGEILCYGKTTSSLITNISKKSKQRSAEVSGLRFGDKMGGGLEVKLTGFGSFVERRAEKSKSHS